MSPRTIMAIIPNPFNPYLLVLKLWPSREWCDYKIWHWTKREWVFDLVAFKSLKDYLQLLYFSIDCVDDDSNMDFALSAVLVVNNNNDESVFDLKKLWWAFASGFSVRGPFQISLRQNDEGWRDWLKLGFICSLHRILNSWNIIFAAVIKNNS